MKPVLITGGNGFVGSNLVLELLQRSRPVRILRRTSSDLRALRRIEVEHCIGDVRDPQSLLAAMQECDVVIHAAAMVTFDKQRAEEQREVNVTGTKNVVDACLRAGIERLVHVSSVAALGLPQPGELATEETPFNVERRWGYKFSKLKAEEEVQLGVARGLDAVIVNPSVIVGERDIYFHGGDIIRRVKKWQVPLYIDGGMNVVYVGDVVRGILSALERGRCGERYILAGENLTHKEVFRRTAKIVGGLPPLAKLPLPLLRTIAASVERVSRIAGVRPMITPDLISGAGRFNWYSTAKAQRELNYTFSPFELAIERAYRWYKENHFL